MFNFFKTHIMPNFVKIAKFFNLQVRTIAYIAMLLLLIGALSLSIASVDSFVEYSSLPIGLTKALIGIIFLAMIDDIVFAKIDTVVEIQNKNTGYAIIYLANAIIIAACIGFA